MKKLYVYMVLVVSMIVGVLSPVRATAEETPTMMDLVREAKLEVVETDQPKSAVLIDANTGKLLWSENEDEPHNPASIMKLMVVYLAYEAIADGKLTMDTTVTADARYAQIASIYEISNNNIVEGVEYPVKELIPMVLVPSSNVATLMLADLIEPDANKMLTMMNDTAKELGMKDTTIINATGAEVGVFQGLYAKEGVDTSQLQMTGSNVTTARDFATFTYFLLEKYPEILEYTNQPKVTVMAGTPYQEEFDTYNYSLTGLEHAYEGTDGLKTGSSPSAGFNIDMTAKRGDLRLISIVFGVGDWADQTGEYKRHPFANAMMDYGFNHFEYKEILKKGEHQIDEKDVIVESDLKDTVKKDQGDLKFTINDKGMVLSSNPLQPVSLTIKPETVKYKEKETTALEDVKKKTSSIVDKFLSLIGIKKGGESSTNLLFIIVGVIIVVLIIFIIIRKLVKRRKRKQRRAEIMARGRRSK